MRVLFVAARGFDKNGGFIEVDDGAEPTGNEQVYQADGYLRISLKCRDISLRHNFEVRSEPPEASADTSDLNRTSSRSIISTGEIEGRSWRRYRLSMLGSENEHTSVCVNIHESATSESVFAAGHSGSYQDNNTGEVFFVEAYVTPDRMDEIMREIQMPGAELMVSVALGKFPNFYATWSPEIDDGRVIKYLDSRRDVENAADIPEDFWNREIKEKAMSNPDRKPIQITIGRNIGEWLQSETDDDDLETTEEARSVPADEARIVTDPAGAQVITAAAAKLSRRIVFLAAAVLIGAVIIAM